MKTLIKSLLAIGFIIFLVVTTSSCLKRRLISLDESFRIVVDYAPFASVRQAAGAEASVDWSGTDVKRMNACTESFAALELQALLKKLAPTKADDAFSLQSLAEALPQKAIVLATLTPSSHAKINAIIRKKKLAQKLTKEESFAIVPQGQRIYIIGHDRVGTLYGVYYFLEMLGVRWYDLGTIGEFIPPTPALQVAAKTIVETPKFVTRGFWAWEDRGNHDFYVWMARNRLNFWTIAEPNRAFLKKLGIQLTVGGHLHFDRFLHPAAEYPFDFPLFKGDEDKPADPYQVDKTEYRGDVNRDGKLSYFEAHPEWYGLYEGKRQTFSGDFGTNVCTSNKDVIDELCRKLVDDLADGEWRDANTLNFWPLDGGKWCECDNCKKLGAPTDRLLLLIHQVRSAIAQAEKQGRINRNIKVIFPIYNETLTPPTRPLPQGFDYENCIGTVFPIRRCYVHFLDDTTCTEFNTRIWQDFLGWVKKEPHYYQGQFFMGEYYNVSAIKSLPVIYTRIMSHDIPLYYRDGARHFHYMHVYTRLWGEKRINNYLMAKLLWNPDVNVKTLADDYFDHFYGPASGRMKRLYAKLEYAMSSVKQWKHTKPLTERIYRDKKPLFNLEHLHLKEYHPSANDGVDLEESVLALKACRSIMDSLLQKQWPDVMQQRLADDDKNLRYGENTVNFYYYISQCILAKRAGDVDKAREFYRKTIPYAKALKAETEIVQTASSHANAKDGLDATRIEKVYYKLGKELGI